MTFGFAGESLAPECRAPESCSPVRQNPGCWRAFRADDRALLGGYLIYAVFFGGYADRTWSRMDDDYFSTFRMGLLLFYYSTFLLY